MALPFCSGLIRWGRAHRKNMGRADWPDGDGIFVQLPPFTCTRPVAKPAVLR
ncbi:MAG: hypothetical protein WBC68_03505 [Albidovulum sp.]